MNYRAGQLLAVWDCNVLITLKALNTFPVLMREGAETLQEAVACPNPWWELGCTDSSSPPAPLEKAGF